MFESPANDFIEKDLDLNAYLVQRKSSTFFMRVSGFMQDAGIGKGDLLAVDKALNAQHNGIVVCWMDGEYQLKRVFKQDNQIYLLCNGADTEPLQLGENDSIWGVVIGVIKKLR